LYSHDALCAGDPRSDALCVTLIRASDDRALTMQLLMQKRNRWRTWQTIKQREWQVRSKHTHSDSEAIRERYVRCAT
ncbi:MAG: hypothetical protein LC687_05695, partial [Actinobacteria bacterium]|nr:hypothetical protein [Actinomycetota bacterium]